MKRIYLLAAALLLAAAIATSAQAQARPGATPVPRPAPAQTPAPRPTAPPAANPVVPNSKIAFVDTTMFGDEKNGIARYVSGVKSLEREFQAPQAELLNMQNRLKTIADDITRMRAAATSDPKAIQAKQDEGERLQRDLKRKKEDYDAMAEKRYEAVMGPLNAEIGKALDQFAQRNGITTTLDVSKIGPALLTALPGTDVTQAFIADFNSRNPAPRP
jgi:Skp family chaperone for outer membrane proteins